MTRYEINFSGIEMNFLFFSYFNFWDPTAAPALSTKTNDRIARKLILRCSALRRHRQINRIFKMANIHYSEVYCTNLQCWICFNSDKRWGLCQRWYKWDKMKRTIEVDKNRWLEMMMMDVYRWNNDDSLPCAQMWSEKKWMLSPFYELRESTFSFSSVIWYLTWIWKLENKRR